MNVKTQFEKEMQKFNDGLSGGMGVAVAPVPKKTYTPCGQLVALHVYQLPNTKGGLALPDGMVDPYVTTRSLVIAAGPDCKKVKVGDVVLMHVGQGATQVYHKGQKTFVVNEDYIQGIEDRDDEAARTDK